jgi:hypothetical protein
MMNQEIIGEKIIYSCVCANLQMSTNPMVQEDHLYAGRVCNVLGRSELQVVDIWPRKLKELTK